MRFKGRNDNEYRKIKKNFYSFFNIKILKLRMIILISELKFTLLASFRIYKNIFVTTFFVRNNSFYFFPVVLDSCCFLSRFCRKEFFFSGSGLNYFSSIQFCTTILARTNLESLVVQPVQLYFISFVVLTHSSEDLFFAS